MPDLATRRGFAVSNDEALGCTAGAALSPGRATGVETADLARKFLVTDTDLKVEGFFTDELVRIWPASCFNGSTLPGRLMSVSEPPLASATAWDSVAECSPESPLARGSRFSCADALDCLCSFEIYVSQLDKSTFVMSQLTVEAGPPAVSDTCALSAGAACARFAFASVEVEEALGVVCFVVAVPEGGSPLTAGELVVDAVSSMGARRPIDCASFTTSLATCSAITVSGTVEAQDAMSDPCSISLKVPEGRGDDCCESSPAERPCSSIGTLGLRKVEGNHLMSDATSRHELQVGASAELLSASIWM